MMWYMLFYLLICKVCGCLLLFNLCVLFKVRVENQVIVQGTIQGIQGAIQGTIQDNNEDDDNDGNNHKCKQPTLVCSWHCNMVDYVEYHSPAILRSLTMHALFDDGLCGLLPYISDRILTPTRSTDPKVIDMWKGRSGVCNTGIEKGSFRLGNKNSQWGEGLGREKTRFSQGN
mmetsp:Transcript_15422/g.18779  ORF Transcript_15422/g.18779 Transcript_15422/m.18779 type:complete len:173 (+) Transcript_15422:237-755(+)